MSLTQDDIVLRAALAPARDLEPNAAEVASVLARAAGGRASARSSADMPWTRFALPVLASLALLAAVAYSVPATRAAIGAAAEGVAGIFDGWGSTDSAGQGPGRPLGPGEPAPSYFREGSWSAIHDPRVIAEAGGYRLVAYRERNGDIGFDLGDTGVGMGGYHASDFDNRAICLLGPGSMQGPDENGHIPYFGVSSPTVRSIALEYGGGPPERGDTTGGGFVLLTVPSREPVAVTAYGADGAELGHATIGAAGSYC